MNKCLERNRYSEMDDQINDQIDPETALTTKDL